MLQSSSVQGVDPVEELLEKLVREVKASLHSENISVVAQAIPLLEQFSDAATADVARRHLLQLQRFGRYPHRNAALGRVSSPEEVVFTQQLQR